MAQGGRNKSGSGGPRTGGALSGPRPPAGKASGGRPSGRSPAGKRPAGRQSVAAARRSSGSNRTQLIIGVAAVVIIAAIVVLGLVLNKKNNAVQGAGYGVSKSSTATVDSSGIITVSNGTPTLSLDLYEDALCPICGEFEQQYGQQIAKAIDDGQLTVHYHMVDFLNASSASKNYSTRAYAALIAVAKDSGSKPGVLMAFHTALFDPANQPKENGSTDLSNTELGALAVKAGASTTAQQTIDSGNGVSQAGTDATTNSNALDAVAAAAGTSPGTPTVVNNGKPVEINSVSWLTNLLAAEG